MGGGCYDRLQNIVCTIALFLLLVINIFAEVPHTTIVENPSKEVTKVETLKRRDKAELNITVEKKKSKEVIGYVDGTKVIIPKEKNPQVNFEDSYKIMDNLQGKISKGYTVTTTEEGIEIEGSKVPNFLYLVGKTGTWKWNNKVKRNMIQPRYIYEGYANYEIDDSYENEWIIFGNSNYAQGLIVKTIPKGIILKQNGGSGLYANREKFYEDAHNSFKLIKWLFSDYRNTDYHGFNVKYNYPYAIADEQIINVSQNIQIMYKCDGNSHSIKLLKYPKQSFILHYGFVAESDIYQGDGNSFVYWSQAQHTMYFKYVIRTLEGKSTLTIREKYPLNKYIQFNSTAFEEGKPLALENSLTDVTFNTTGKGIVTMIEGDILEIDGKQVKIGSGGNLGVQTATIGNLKYSYKVEAGKLRLALNEWGILEPNHDLKIIVNRNGAKKSEHTLTIDSPRRVEGTNNIKVDNNYQIRNIIKFNGISLDTPSSFALESPIPTGVTLAEQTGYGIPLLDEGDTIQVDDRRTRTVHSYTIQSGGSLPSQRVEFSNGSIDLQVVNRKVQVRLNNWKVNEPMRLNLRAIRGVNEISNHEITLTAPEAPFNMLETGNLDFGTVLQGAKNKKAESNIRIEMLAGQDVSEVKFNLREEQPIMTNSQGTELKVKRIDKTVQKVRDREYNIKLRGTLDVPEEQQSGEYRGSNILDIEVK